LWRNIVLELKMKRLKFLILCLLILYPGIYLKAQVNGGNMTYDQNIQIICNLSDVNSQRTERRSVKELLVQNVGGFRFHLYWDHENSRLLYRRPIGQLQDFGPVMDDIGNYLNENPDRILTLFLDLDLPIDTLHKVFKERNLLQYFHRQSKDQEWPKISEMVQSGKRIVLFTMEQIFNQPDWLHHVWSHAVEPYFSLFEAPNFLGEFLKGDPKNALLMINDFNFPSNRLDNSQSYVIDQNTNPYLLNHCLTVWRNTGKVPNFIFLDQYTDRMQTIVGNLRSFSTISGRITYNREILDYVNWEDRDNCQTSGKYVFPVVPGDRITLKPSVPGFTFTPESVFFDEPSSSIVQNFVANPMEITEGLVAFYPFEGDARDNSLNTNHGKSARVSFVSDKLRGNIASFKGNSYIVLPEAEILSLRDHSFTVSAWVKLSENDNIDNSILGTTVRSYQEGIHFTVREKRPYFGFYSNDIQGNKVIENDTWYHIVARYNKLNGEQAIFVNGELDNRSLGHAAYQGKEEIIIGNASFGWRAFFNGDMDDLTIWSRPLGEQEIFNLAMDVVSIYPARRSIINTMTIIIGGSVIIIGILISIIVRRSRKSVKSLESTTTSGPSGITPVLNREDVRRNNLIKLFGSFQVLNRDGVDITMEFTPKIKSLFLVILLHSTKSKNGITTAELTQIVWPEFSFKSAKNSRGVTMRKLRLILEQLDKVEIEFNRERWFVQLSNHAYCDYFECIHLLDNPQFNNLEYYYRLFHIVEDGQIVKNESYEWMDDIKGYVDYRVIDLLLKYIGLLNEQEDADLILKIIDRIHISDPVNEKAVELKIRILLSQDNYNYAKYCYDTFSKNFEEFYGQTYQRSFDEMVSLANQ
jgi:DNA-binding SARP family transcriptional activator